MNEQAIDDLIEQAGLSDYVGITNATMGVDTLSSSGLTAYTVLSRLLAHAIAAEWARSVATAQACARRGENAQAVLDALWADRSRIDGLVK